MHEGFRGGGVSGRELEWKDFGWRGPAPGRLAGDGRGENAVGEVDPLTMRAKLRPEVRRGTSID